MRNEILKGNFNIKGTITGVLFLIVFWGQAFTAGGVDRSQAPFFERTPYYRIETDVGDDFAKLIASHMDAMYKEYKERFRSYNLKPAARPTVRVFRQRSRYDSVIPDHLQGTAGCYLAKDNLIMAFVGDRTTDEVLHTLYHEAFHQFLFDRVGDNMPLWLNEGLAEYFAEAIWTGSGVVTGQRPRERLQILQKAIRNNSFIPFHRLFPMPNARWLANVKANSDLADLQYSQAWSVIHFLFHAEGGKYYDRLADYVRYHVEEVPMAEAFRKSFGSNIAAMQRAWKNYVMRLEMDHLSKCRTNMLILLSLVEEVYDEPAHLQDMGHFLRQLIGNESVEWRVDKEYGVDITSERNREEIKKIFLCPDIGKGASQRTYILINDAETGLPELYCPHFDGVMIKAYFVRRQSRWLPVAELIYRAVPDDDFLLRLDRKSRESSQ